MKLCCLNSVLFWVVFGRFEISKLTRIENIRISVCFQRMRSRKSQNGQKNPLFIVILKTVCCKSCFLVALEFPSSHALETYALTYVFNACEPGNRRMAQKKPVFIIILETVCCKKLFFVVLGFPSSHALKT